MSSSIWFGGSILFVCLLWHVIDVVPQMNACAPKTRARLSAV